MGNSRYKIIGNNRTLTPETNLSLSITGADEANEGSNTIYNMVLTMTGLIWAEWTQVVITLPAWISYVWSVDGVNDWQIITWTIGDLIGNYVRQFTIVSSTQAVYNITGVLTTSTANFGTATASKEITVIEPMGPPPISEWCKDDEAMNYNPSAWSHNQSLCVY